jgi:myxalamid-type polyketide synthase MxaB
VTETAGATPIEASAETADRWSPFVKLTNGQTQPPLFCIHPVGGDVRCYFELARRFESAWPVWALRARGLEGGLPPHESVEELATDYATAIQEACPQGPYYLAGWSTGGIFALEIAHRLRQQDAEVGALIFFDSPAPSIFRGVDLDDHARFLYDLVNFSNWFAGTQMRVSYEELKKLDAETAFETALAEAKSQGALPAESSAEQVRRLVDVCKAHVRAVMQYAPPAYDQALHMFRPMNTDTLVEASGRKLDETLGWGETLQKGMVTHQMPGDHFSMMTGGNVARVAEALLECLRGDQSGD